MWPGKESSVIGEMRYDGFRQQTEEVVLLGGDYAEKGNGNRVTRNGRIQWTENWEGFWV